MIFETLGNEIAAREAAEEQAAIDARQAAWELVRSAVIADLRDEPGPLVEDLIHALETLGHECPSLTEIRRAVHQIRLGGGLAALANWPAEDMAVRALEHTRLKDAEYQRVVERRQVLTQGRDGWRSLMRMFQFTDRLLAPLVTPETARLTRKVGPPISDN